MYVLRIDRPKQALEDYHPKGTRVTIEFEYEEMILLEHALCSYEEQGKVNSKEDKSFFWQFCALRDFCKQGGMTSWIAEHYSLLFGEKRTEEEKTDEE